MTIGENTAGCEPGRSRAEHNKVITKSTSWIPLELKTLFVLLAIWLWDLESLHGQPPNGDLKTLSGFQATVSRIHQLEDRQKLDEALVEGAKFAEAIEQLYGSASPLTALAKRELAEAYMLHSDFGHPLTLLEEALKVFDSDTEHGKFEAALTKVDLGMCDAMIGQFAQLLQHDRGPVVELVVVDVDQRELVLRLGQPRTDIYVLRGLHV
jgi:hypothetical protein